ncbi:MAG: SGNH/GDSL hydrolase family protein [Sedimenticola sp.]
MGSPNRKYEIYTGIAILALTFGLFLAGELALRTIQLMKFGQQESVEKSSAYYVDQATGLRLNVPNRQLGHIRINNIGFRGPDLVLEKSDNTLRLAFLGASTTYDAYSPEGKNWPHLVSSKLQQLADCETDFVNGGKPGYSSDETIKLFNNFIEKTTPDIVLIFPSDINSDLEWQAEQQGLDVDHTSYRSPLNDYSLLLQKLEKNFRIIRLQRGAEKRAKKLHMEKDVLVERFKSNLSRMIDAVSAKERIVVVITISDLLRREMSMRELVKAGNTRLYYMPYAYLPDVIELREAYNVAIEEIADREGVVLVSGENDIPASSRFFTDSVHYTPDGSEAMAERVVRYLLKSPQFLSLLTRKNCRMS